MLGVIKEKTFQVGYIWEKIAEILISLNCVKYICNIYKI